MKRLLLVIIVLVVAALVSNAQAKAQSILHEDMNHICTKTNFNSKVLFITSSNHSVHGFLRQP